ncbi:hypothetical protein NON08_14765 [Cetobacterium somerae]|uniref:hypothetical protein n=1 Tax=Cetobacterium sp. NK01 TaxID=2993530 RepID=UPI00211615E4|nr:hypothetical protein [Cetobacterium sp. NK01]MCQ8213761.1 hypothetical protein [Cetobacterium sp. NK01]
MIRFREKNGAWPIDEESKKIDNVVSLQYKQIQKLKEYKEILIDNAVTGKIKVGDYHAKQD